MCGRKGRVCDSGWSGGRWMRFSGVLDAWMSKVCRYGGEQSTRPRGHDAGRKEMDLAPWAGPGRECNECSMFLVRYTILTAAMLCYAMLCYAMLCYAMLHYNYTTLPSPLPVSTSTTIALKTASPPLWVSTVRPRPRLLGSWR